MRQPMIGGNWKMNGSKRLVQTLLSELKNLVAENDEFEWLVCPPYLYIPAAQQILAGSGISLGAQDIAVESGQGAFTGEISGEMLREFGCEYVLVGHSERRHIYLESNELCAKKAQTALAAGLKPILCVGETLEERKSAKTFEIIEKQLAALLTLIDNHAALKQVVISYEPVWAIGTGESATDKQAEEVHTFIRQTLAAVNEELSQTIRILYGGSVKPSNAAALLAMPDVDGALVGGAALEAKSFFEIGDRKSVV